MKRLDSPGWQSIDLRRLPLPRLDLFERSPRVPITLQHFCPPDRLLQPWFEYLPHHVHQFVHSGVGYYAREGAASRDPERWGDLWLTVGYSDNTFYCGVNVGGPSKAFHDPEYRGTLFRRIFEEMGVSAQITSEFAKGRLAVLASSGGQYRLRFMAARPDGTDPTALRVLGFQDLPAARFAIERVLRSIPRSVEKMGVFCVLNATIFDEIRMELAQIATGWTCDLYGRLGQPLNEIVTTGGLPDVPYSIPAFEWRDDHYESFFQSDFVVVPNGGYIEITSNCESVERFLKRAEGIIGLSFEPVTTIAPEP